MKEPLSENISIHSLRMEGDDYYETYFDKEEISIHSLRMEGDAKCAITDVIF